PARCAPSARGDLLPAAAAPDGAPEHERRLPGTGGGTGTPRGHRLRRSLRRTSPHRGTDRGDLPRREHPATAAAGDARLARRGPGSRRRPAGVPETLRAHRRDPVVSPISQRLPRDSPATCGLALDLAVLLGRAEPPARVR